MNHFILFACYFVPVLHIFGKILLKDPDPDLYVRTGLILTLWILYTTGLIIVCIFSQVMALLVDLRQLCEENDETETEAADCSQ